MFQITVEDSFAAAHRLREYEGKCRQVHGHNYRVRVSLEGEQLDETGLLVDFGEDSLHGRIGHPALDHEHSATDGRIDGQERVQAAGTKDHQERQG